MKFLTVILTLFSAMTATASPVNMACITEYPTTTFIGQTEGDKINFRLIHHNGVKYMPIWSSVITPNDLSVLTEVASVLSDLGDELTFSMDEKNCNVDGLLINCFGSDEVQEIGGHKVTMWGVYTSATTDTSFAGIYNYIWSTMALDIDGKSYYVPMRYGENECFKDWNAKGLNKKIKAKNLFLK